MMLTAHRAPDRIAHRTPAAVLAAPAPPPDKLLESLGPCALTVRYERDEEVCFQGDRAVDCFEVVTGCIRTVRLLEDGRRYIGEFLFPGDVLGCEMAGQYEFGAEAVTPTTLRRYRISAVEERAAQDLGFAQRLRRHSACQVRQAWGRMILLGRKTAAERIASFLLEMRDRTVPSAPGAFRGAFGGPFELPMSRGDIADYLGLTTETVCRGLAELRQQGIVAVNRAHVTILDPAGLTHAGSDQVH